MLRKLTPLSIGIITILLAAVSITLVLMASENPLQVFKSTPDETVAEVWFPESGVIKTAIGGGATVRLAIIVGSERPIAVSCPSGFDPEMTKTYIAESVVLETFDGLYTQPVWVLRPSERPKPPASTGELVIVK